MSEYKCKDCDRIFRRKDYYIKHINRKIKCTNNYKTKCIYCNKFFKTKGNVTRHMISSCKEYNNIKKEKNKLLEEINKLNKIKNKINTIINNNITNNNKNILNTNSNNITNNITNNNNITINLYPYGKEDMNRIDKRYIEKAINKIFYSPLELVKQVHFNDKYPEYHNIFIPNIKGNYIKIHRGDNKWDIVPKKEYIDELYVNKKNYIEDKYYENKDKYSNIKQERLDKFIDSENDGKTATDIKKYIEYLLYNEKCKPLILQRKLNE